jgi:hypothetical protein
MSKERKEKKKTVDGENTKESNSDGVLFEAYTSNNSKKQKEKKKKRKAAFLLQL